MNLFMFFCPSFLRDLSIKVWVFGLILTTVSHFSLAEQQWTAVYLTAAAAKYKNTSSSKTYNGNSIPIQVKAVHIRSLMTITLFLREGYLMLPLKQRYDDKAAAI